MSTNKKSLKPNRLTAKIMGVKESLITIDVSDVQVKKNEVGYILLKGERLKAEILRIQSGVADLQVFEDTSATPRSRPSP